MYESLLPDEDQLRGALAALGLPVPAALEDEDPQVRACLLAAHLRRGAERASRNLFTAADRAAAVEIADRTRVHNWPVPEDHRLAALLHLGRASDHLDVLATDLSAPGAVGLDVGGQVGEGFAAAAGKLVETAGHAIRLRSTPDDLGLACDRADAEEIIEVLDDASTLLNSALNRREAATYGVANQLFPDAR
ncbi:hypothetical protein ACFW1A_14270 [Kitasatospora sp. NPDC058965]|uniref:hypothetical protein n=1 Tax=Kitasatospora sp. NPDC058965 TaxID=3346682 RepID=UPI0036B6A9E0